MSTPELTRKASLWQTVRAVCWSFFGIRKSRLLRCGISMDSEAIFSSGSLVSIGMMFGYTR